MMKNLKPILIISLVLLFFSGVTHANNKNGDDAFTKDIKHLFQINGSSASFEQSVKTMIIHFKSQESNIPSEYWQKAEKEFLNTSIDDLMEMIVPVYKKNLSHEDVRAMIAFFESEAGKRIAKKIPEITNESMQAGMIWGQTIGKKIHDDIENKGYKIRLPFMQ